jgi:ATP-binding cassette subfamily B protein
MNSKTHLPNDLLGLPLFWQKGVLSQVHLGENVLAWLEVDLNDELRFKKILVILTDQRVISIDGIQNSWNFYPLTPDLSLRVMDHAGVGTLALQQGSRRLAAWRFTLGLEAAVLRWKLRF